MLRSVFQARLFRIGLILLVIGTGPLALSILLDPKGNPVGLGLLAFFTFWPSIGLIVAGLVQSAASSMRPRQSQ